MPELDSYRENHLAKNTLIPGLLVLRDIIDIFLCDVRVRHTDTQVDRIMCLQKGVFYKKPQRMNKDFLGISSAIANH